MKHIGAVLIAIFMIGCDSIEKENVKFIGYISELKSSIDLNEFNGVVIIPSNRCGSCVTVAINYLKENAEKRSDVLFIVNEIRSLKEVKIRYGIPDTLENVIIDKSDLFLKSRLNFGNVGYYLLTQGDIREKKIFDPVDVMYEIQEFDSLTSQ